MFLNPFFHEFPTAGNTLDILNFEVYVWIRLLFLIRNVIEFVLLKLLRLINWQLIERHANKIKIENDLNESIIFICL